ncbi:MAG: DUF4065 domain-containing protein [Boseongicola sp.]|nr:DUF4065 domain-containing protein [Boseongicola sp.]
MKSSVTVANEFIGLAQDAGKSLTNMQVLKLVYICHGWMLALHHRPLIDDDIEAWQYGPVIPSLYNKLRKFRSKPVKEVDDLSGEALDETEKNLIKQVYKAYGHLSGPMLSRITHKSGSPWDLTYEPGSFGDVISDDLIQDHYSRLAG